MKTTVLTVLATTTSLLMVAGCGQQSVGAPSGQSQEAASDSRWIQCKQDVLRSDAQTDVNAILVAVIEKSGDDLASLKSYAGHIAARQVEYGSAEFVDLYGIFKGQGLASSLSPRATKYVDADYYRFNDFNSIDGQNLDGGSMWGTLVVGKRALAADLATGETFEAHYVFQEGDHFGGTLDMTCKERW